MTRTLLVAIPCRVITLNMKFGAEDGASTLEELVLRAVAGGRTTVRGLGTLFHLPDRLLLDVVHGLWSKGFLAVDFDANTLETTETAQAITREPLGKQAMTTTMRTQKFLFDPVTEVVMPHHNGADRVPYGAIEMPLALGLSEKDIPRTDLLRAVREAVRVDRKHGMHRRVHEVSFANPLLSPPEAVHWTCFEVVLGREPGTGKMTATPATMPPGWNQRSLQLFRTRVGDLIETRPENKFVRRLLAQQDVGAVAPVTLRSLMVDLGKSAKGLSDVPFDKLGFRDEALRTTAAHVLELVEQARRSRCSVQGIAPGAGVAWVVGDLLETAVRQVVLVLPRISYDALRPVLPALESAAKRGVTLVLLWGDLRSSTLDGKVATALYDLQARFRDRVLLEQRSSRCSAAAVICDDQRAYLGSRSVFAEDSGAGVLVGPVAGSSEAPECVTEMLRWVKGVYPYWQTAQRIEVRPSNTTARQKASAEPTPSPDITLPDALEEWDDDPVGYRARWSAAWGRVLRQLLEAASGVYRGAPVVRAVWDGMYADMVRQAIPTTTKRLAVTDDSADAAACGDEFAQQLLDLLDRKAVVHLQHPPFKEGHQPAAKYATVLKGLRTAQTLRATRGKARAVLCDHEMFIGSYRPLGHRTASPGHDSTTQLGLHIANTAFTAEFARELGIPEWFGSAEDVPDYLPPLPTLAAAEIDDDPWTVLRARLLAGANPDRLRRESAALLSGPTGEKSHRQAWGQWLLHDAWHRRAFVEAYLLAPLLGGGGDDSMPVELAAVAVPLEHGPLGDRLYDSAVELLDARWEHRMVALVGAVAEMLLHGGEAGRLVCGELADPGGTLGDGLPPTWLRLLREAITCFDAKRSPLPLQDVNAWAEDQRLVAESKLGWSRLVGELRNFERAEQHFNFVDGQRMHRALFRQEGVFARVLDMAREDTTAELRSRTARELPDNARAYMNRLTAQLGLVEIHWRNHLPYARRVDGFLDEARRLTALSAAEEKKSAALSGAMLLPVLTAPQRVYARFLEQEWHNLVAEAEALGEPTRHPVEALLGAFASLPMIGKDDR